MTPTCMSRNAPQTDSFFAAAVTSHKSAGLAKPCRQEDLEAILWESLGYEFGNFQPLGICSYYCYLQNDKAVMEIRLVRSHWESCLTNHMHMGNVSWWKGPLQLWSAWVQHCIDSDCKSQSPQCGEEGRHAAFQKGSDNYRDCKALCFLPFFFFSSPSSQVRPAHF